MRCLLHFMFFGLWFYNQPFLKFSFSTTIKFSADDLCLFKCYFQNILLFMYIFLFARTHRRVPTPMACLYEKKPLEATYPLFTTEPICFRINHALHFNFRHRWLMFFWVLEKKKLIWQITSIPPIDINNFYPSNLNSSMPTLD